MLIYIIDHNGSQVIIYIYHINNMQVQKLFITCICLDVPICMRKLCWPLTILSEKNWLFIWHFLNFLISKEKHSSYFTFYVCSLHRHSSYLLTPVKLRKKHELPGDEVLITAFSELTPSPGMECYNQFLLFVSQAVTHSTKFKSCIALLSLLKDEKHNQEKGLFKEVLLGKIQL